MSSHKGKDEITNSENSFRTRRPVCFISIIICFDNRNRYIFKFFKLACGEKEYSVGQLVGKVAAMTKADVENVGAGITCTFNAVELHRCMSDKVTCTKSVYTAVLDDLYLSVKHANKLPKIVIFTLKVIIGFEFSAVS